MAFPAKKPSLGAVAADMGDDEEAPESKDSGAYDAAVDEFLESIGVSEDKLEEAREAFKAAVASCM